MVNTTTPWQGTLELTYGLRQGKTQIIHNFAQAPLKFQIPFYPENPSICHSVILHTAGGMVGGDRLQQNIMLAPHTNTLITTAAAAKVYRSQEEQVINNINIKMAQGSSLEWLPQTTILFNGAAYSQTMRVELAENANFCGWEIMRLGRSARGEKFLSGKLKSHLEIWLADKPLWIDRQNLPGSKDIFDSPHGLDNKPVVGSLIWLGIPVKSETITHLRYLWSKLNYKADAGLSLTANDGVICRYRGYSTTEVRNWFTQVWHYLRNSLQDRPMIKPRVWFV